MIKSMNGKRVVKVKGGWEKLPDEEKDRHLDLTEIIDWYYSNKEVTNVQFLDNGNSEWAYITLRRETP